MNAAASPAPPPASSADTASETPSDTRYVLYGAQGSGSSIAEIGLQACAQPYRLVRAARWEEDSALDELERVNPLGQIPTLVTPEGAVLTESAAILMHLGLRFPASGLLGDDDAARDQILRGLVYIAANCYSAITATDYPERFTTSEDAAARDAVKQAARQRLHRHWAMFADQFPPHPWLSGARPAALDVMAAIVSKWSGTRAFLEKERPEFLALLQRIEAHPLVAAVHARHWPG